VIVRRLSLNLDFRASVTLEERMEDLVRWVADKGAVERVDHATTEFVEPSLTR